MSNEFNCPILFSQQTALSGFIGKIDAGADAKAFLDSPAGIEVRNLAGRINYYADKAKPTLPVVTVADCPADGKYKTFAVANPGTIYSGMALGDGMFSWQVTNSMPLRVGVGESPGSFATEGGGTGNSERLPIKIGQWFSMALAPNVVDPSTGPTYSIV